MLPKKVKIKVANQEYDVPTEEYIRNKTKQLIEFGYRDLTETEVKEQVNSVLTKKEWGNGLTVIGLFLQKDLVVPE